MTTTARQNNLILAEDWKRIYQTFTNADFTSYDFENLRRVMIAYLRENYAEDFNDYIESSEYIALVDLIAFLGQSLAFRIDLSSRENFIELATRKESVLRMARMLAYNAKRNKAANGLLKFDTVSTTETLYDSNGVNLAKQTIVWNDSTNSNWYQQFITVLNAAMVTNTEFGKSQGTAIVDGITADQYRFNSTNTGLPVFSFTKQVAGRSMRFEILSTSILGADSIYEETPMPGNQLGFLYRQDGKGNASPNSGFFLQFKQGSMTTAEFQIPQPTVNEIVGITTNNINNDDVWLYQLDSNGNESTLWSQVSSLTGNNTVYNSIANGQKNIYSVITKTNDQIDLLFSDGVYGNLPRGAFRAYYRVSNGLRYQISSSDMRGIAIDIPYVNSAGVSHILTVSMSLNYSISNSASSEDVDTIRTNAPAVYYTQNRMITGEDYNLAPLGSSQDILKVKAINRTSSGISRNFDIIDASGKYSNVNVFCDDGLIYRYNSERTFSYTSVNKNILLNYVKETIEPAVANVQTYNFYITNFDKIFLSDVNVKWIKTTSDSTATTGYFGNAFDNFPIKVGTYTASNLKYVEAGSLVKFIPVLSTQAFKNGEIVDYDPLDVDQQRYIWSKAVQVTGDGTNAGKGNLANGLGPIKFSEIIPHGAKPSQVVPRFISNFNTDIETEIVNLSFARETFGLRYDRATRSWKTVTSGNIDLMTDFNLGQAGDTTNKGLDASWILAFVYDGETYTVRLRGTDYIFSSVQQNRFYFDVDHKIYDSKTRKVIKDTISVLAINRSPLGSEKGSLAIANQILAQFAANPNSKLSDILPIVDEKQILKQDIPFSVSDAVRYDDGYQANESIKIAFSDTNDDGVIDNPDAFDEIVGVNSETKYLFFQQSTDEFGAKSLTFIPNMDSKFIVKDKEANASVNDYGHNQLIYFYDQKENYIKRVDLVTRSFILEPSYVAYVGRSDLKFQYVHNSGESRRIDPSVSNIIDIYLMTRTYDENYRMWLAGGLAKQPEAPTPEALRVEFASGLSQIKSISDEVVYHPVSYFPLFGSKARSEFQVTFKVVKNPSKLVNDNDLKVRIVNSITAFFAVENFDFGDKFYASELLTYVIKQNSPDISNMVIVPKQTTQAFGSLLEIQAKPDELLVSAATVDDIEILTNITAADLKLLTTQVITSTSVL
jgi:hypothetical protein